jgi:hypothetical protein
MPQKQITTLKQCMRAAGGNKTKMDACEATFKAAGGTVQPDGGKVFTAPDQSGAFVTTGGKVF